MSKWVLECQTMILGSIPNVKKRKANNEKRKTNTEKRKKKTKSEKRIRKNEKRKTNQLHTVTLLKVIEVFMRSVGTVNVLKVRTLIYYYYYFRCS